MYDKIHYKLKKKERNKGRRTKLTKLEMKMERSQQKKKKKKKNVFEPKWWPVVAQRLKPLPAMPETWDQSLGREDPLEKEVATHSRILAWRIPWTEEPGGLQSTGSQRVRHDWVTSLSLSIIHSYRSPYMNPMATTKAHSRHQKLKWKATRTLLKKTIKDFLGGSEAKTPCLQYRGLVWALVRELDPTCHN